MDCAVALAIGSLICSVCRVMSFASSCRRRNKLSGNEHHNEKGQKRRAYLEKIMVSSACSVSVTNELNITT